MNLKARDGRLLCKHTGDNIFAHMGAPIFLQFDGDKILQHSYQYKNDRAKIVYSRVKYKVTEYKITWKDHALYSLDRKTLKLKRWFEGLNKLEHKCYFLSGSEYEKILGGHRVEFEVTERSYKNKI